jgi:hypothetical protein
MNESTENFLKSIEQSFIKSKFSNLEPDFNNIVEVYTNNLNVWYYLNSDEVIKKDGNKEINTKIDTINQVVLLNPENFIFSKKQNGFELTEIDFINNEFKIFESLIVEKLKPVHKKQFDFYTSYLSEKRTTLEYTLKDYYNHYIKTGRFGFTVCLTYKSNQFDELSKRLTDTKKRYDYIFNKLNDSQRIEFKNDFCDQLEKLKTKQTESKNIEIIQTLFLKINDEYNHYHRNSKLQIDEYKNAIIGDFQMICRSKNDNDALNPFYYYSQIRSFIKDKNNFVKTNTNLKSNLTEVLLFNSTLESILIETFKVFRSSIYYNIDEVHIINEFNICKIKLIDNLKVLKSFSQSINIELQKNEINNAIYLKNYCVTQFKNFKSFLSLSLFIDIDKSPLKNDFDEVLTELQNSVDIKEVEILMKSSEIVKTEPQLNNIIESKVSSLNDLKINNDFNANHFNQNCYDLFLYLVDNYTLKNEKIIKYINIWYYLKRNVKKDIYTFSLTQIKYSQFIKEKYTINIRKFAKAEFDFEEQVSVLNSLEQQFRNQYFK